MRAVLFDLDGVLVDSYAAHMRSWRRLAAEEGLPFSEREFARSFGRTSRESIAIYWPGRAGDTARLDARKEALFRADIRERFPAMDGGTELVRALHDGGFALAVASSAPPDNVDLTLERLGFADSFGAVVTGRDVQRGKPDPQVFLLAAERLGAPPASCVVVEDAPVGVAAAHAGGMKAVALLSTGRRREDFDEAKPQLLVSSLRELSPADFERLLTG
ncbi:MAG TPA: HAD family phosphatase [Thermoanaerobaculia bacterium]|jgi:beta-phosphoglucomutase|nr:HAD family phosphatase [Thermoanaerobaculia bacterium]